MLGGDGLCCGLLGSGGFFTNLIFGFILADKAMDGRGMGDR